MNQLSNHASSRHSQEWDERLQEWLDGELNSTDTAAFEAHLNACGECQRSLADLEQLDAALTASSPPLQLDARFDTQLFAKIGAIDDSQRAEARRRIEQEWQEQMQVLSRNWRRTLAFVIPGVVAGIAIAFAAAGWLDSSGVTDALVAQGAAELGGRSVDFLRIGITSVVGAALGMLVAPWLARLAD